MNIPKNLLLPLGIGFAVAVPIAVNHDEAYLNHERSGIDRIGDFQREHVLGNIAIGGLVGGTITATALKRGNVGAFLGAAALGVTLGTLAGHFGWDQYLARVEHLPKGDPIPH
jgi:hypothetical protein